MTNEEQLTSESRADHLAPLELDDLVNLCLRRTLDEGGSSVCSGSNITESLRTILELRNLRPSGIPFNVPEALLHELRMGKLVRIGAVLKDKKSGLIVGHLKEVRQGMSTKLIKPGFGLFLAAISIAEQALLNEKLLQIQDLLKQVDSKLDAQNRGLLRKAFKMAGDLAFYNQPSVRTNKIHQIQSDLAQAFSVYDELYENEWNKAELLLNSFKKAWVWNDDSLGQLKKQAEAILINLEVRIGARALYGQLYDELNESAARSAHDAETTALLSSEFDRFLTAFGLASDLRNPKFHRAPSYIVPGSKDQALSALAAAMNDHCRSIESLLSRHLLLVATAPNPPAIAKAKTKERRRQTAPKDT